jgi:hypothetical protein
VTKCISISTINHHHKTDRNKFSTKQPKTIKTREITRLESLSDKCRIKTKLKTIQLHLFDTNRKFP